MSRPNKHIQFESSPSVEEEEEDLFPKIPPAQQDNDTATDYISHTHPHDQGNVSLAHASSPYHVRTPIFHTYEALHVQHNQVQHSYIQQIPPTQVYV